jgi:hypothetical protein
MSHFTVLVTGGVLDVQLAPFAEQNVDPKYLTFCDTEDENRKKYETESRKSFYCSSSSSWGQVISPRLYAQLEGKEVGEQIILHFDKKDMDGMHYWKNNEYYHCGEQQPKHKHPEKQLWVRVIDIIQSTHPDPDVCFEGAIKVQIVAPPVDQKFSDLYSTFEEYMKEWHGDDERDEKTNRYGYWHNENAKWDWYEVGGRWAGFFHIKPEFQHLYEGTKPNFSWGWKDDKKGMAEVIEQRRVDSAKKGHIDWDFMMDKAGKEAEKRYDFVMQNIIGSLPPNETWEVVLADCEDKIKAGAKDIDSREIYWAQPRCKAWQTYSNDPKNRTIFSELGISSFSGSPDDYLVSREQYVDQARRGAICTFAVLHDGKWAERGKMGWWACVSNEKDNWEDIFAKILSQISDDETLTILDCHI